MGVGAIVGRVGEVLVVIFTRFLVFGTSKVLGVLLKRIHVKLIAFISGSLVLAFHLEENNCFFYLCYGGRRLIRIISHYFLSRGVISHGGLSPRFNTNAFINHDLLVCQFFRFFHEIANFIQLILFIREIQLFNSVSESLIVLS